MVVGQEGGFSAMIVSLFLREKLSFRVEVPEQVKKMLKPYSSNWQNFKGLIL